MTIDEVKQMFDGAEYYASHECGLSDTAIEMYRKAFNSALELEQAPTAPAEGWVCRLHTEIGGICDVLGFDCRCGSEPCKLYISK